MKGKPTATPPTTTPPRVRGSIPGLGERHRSGPRTPHLLSRSVGHLPRVTVFMPAYNSARYIGAAIESVLAQRFQDFELLVIDDGSEDDTAGVVASYRDRRIRLEVNEKNLGLPRTRNLGTFGARGEYLALLDSDDVADPMRLARQVAFLDGHPDHALVGSWAQQIDAEGRPRTLLLRPVTAQEIRARLLLTPCFKNTTVTLRRRIALRFPYRNQWPLGEDLDLLSRIALRHPVANLPEVLTCHRKHPEGICMRRRDLLPGIKMEILSEQVDALGMQFGADDLRRHLTLRSMNGFDPDEDFVDWAEDWLSRLRERNLRRSLYPEPAFGLAVGERWLRLFWSARSRPLHATRRFRRSSLARLAKASFADTAASGLRWTPALTRGFGRCVLGRQRSRTGPVWGYDEVAAEDRSS